VGSQLIYNRKSKESLFLGALTSDRLLTIFHLKEQVQARTRRSFLRSSVDGDNEIMKGNRSGILLPLNG